MITSQAETDRLLQQLLAAAPHERPALLKRSLNDDNPSDLLRSLADLSEDWAITDLERATAAARMLADLSDRTGSPSARARTRRAVAQTIAYDNRFEEALAILQEAQTLASRSGDHLEAACAVLTTLHPLARLGRLDEAAREGGAAREVLVRLGHADLAARADINLGVIHRMRDDPEAAITCFRRADSMVAESPLVSAQLKSNLAEALLDLHRFQEAEDVFREALALFESQKAARASAIVAGNIADLLSRQGRFGPAMLLFEQARTALEAEDAEQAAGDVARLQAEQADTLAAAGAHEPAASAYAKAIPVLLGRSLAAEAARAQAGLGRTLLALHQYTPAIKALDAAIEGFTALSHQTAADRARITRALAAAASGDEFDAQHTLAELIERLADRPADSCTARLALAALLIDDGRENEALPIVDLAVEQARQLALSPLLADALHARARVALHNGDLAAAERDLREAIEQIERSRGALQADRLRLAFFAERHRVYEDAFDVALRSTAEQRESVAFEIAELAKSRGLLDLLRADAAAEAPRGAAAAACQIDPLQQRLAQERRVLNSLYAEWDHPRTRPESPEQRAEWRSRLADCEQTIALLESRLTVDTPGADLFAAPTPLHRLEELPDADAAILEYYVSNGRIACFVIRRDRSHVQLLPATVAEVTESARRLHFHIRRAIARSDAGQGMPAADQIRRELRSLHNSLIAPLRPALQDATRLWIVPHGPLHSIPFHALLDEGGYLLEHTTVSTVPSATVLAHVAATEAAAATRSRPRSVLAVGLSDIEIPHAADEALAISALVHGSQRLIGPKATIDAFLRAAPEASILHLATHARFTASDPLASGLKLADGWITAREVASLRLHGATVVLSACESGKTGVDIGGEILGLLRAFLVAGATSIIASYWPVSDAVAREVMADAYEQWHTKGDLPLAASLRLAMLDAAKRRPHPAEWAPFFSVGV